MKRRLLLLVAVLAGSVALSGCLGAGTYVMGQHDEYQAGLWHSTGGDGCYWARLSGFTGSGDEIIENDFSIGGPRYVQVAATDAGFTTSGCGPWYRVGVDDPNPQLAIPGQPFGQGDYRVHLEVAPGRYQSAGPASPGGLCYWERLSGFGGGDIIANGISSAGAAVVDVLSSDVGFSSDGCLTWTKVG